LVEGDAKVIMAKGFCFHPLKLRYNSHEPCAVSKITQKDGKLQMFQHLVRTLADLRSAKSALFNHWTNVAMQKMTGIRFAVLAFFDHREGFVECDLGNSKKSMIVDLWDTCKYNRDYWIGNAEDVSQQSMHGNC